MKLYVIALNGSYANGLIGVTALRESDAYKLATAYVVDRAGGELDLTHTVYTVETTETQAKVVFYQAYIE